MRPAKRQRTHIEGIEKPTLSLMCHGDFPKIMLQILRKKLHGIENILCNETDIHAWFKSQEAANKVRT